MFTPPPKSTGFAKFLADETDLRIRVRRIRLSRVSVADALILPSPGKAQPTIRPMLEGRAARTII